MTSAVQQLHVKEWPRDELESVESCPVCGESARSPLHTDLADRVFFCAPGTWTLHRCHGCGSAYLDPRPTPDSIGLAYRDYYTHAATPPVGVPRAQPGWKRMGYALLHGYLNARYGYAFQPASALGAALLSLLPPIRFRADRKVRHLRRPPAGARLLDVGCGNGAFLTQMRSVGWDVEGLEPDAVAAAAAREAGVSVQGGGLAEYACAEQRYDAVTLNHVIEHVHDPREALRICYRILRPGGILWIATPNLASQGHATFGRDWLHLDPPRHLVLFTPSSLREAVDRAGFERLVTPAAAWTAMRVFRLSAAIKRGADPLNRPPALPFGLKCRAFQADLRTWRRFEFAEEIVLTARRSDG